MRRTLKLEATKPAAPNVLQQQARCDTFAARYNDERPHQALGMKVPPRSTPGPRVSIEGSRTWRIRSTTRPSP